tara:strand:+ start:177 stop:476 length:300 start_codon:yes stop_codon:yes gene_type:complete
MQTFCGLSIVYVTQRDAEFNRNNGRMEGRYSGWYVMQVSEEGPRLNNRQGWEGPYGSPESAWSCVHRRLRLLDPTHPVLAEIETEYRAEASEREARLEI